MTLHLCQPGEGASCGACCGLLNGVDHSRPEVAALLARNTERLAGAPRTKEGFHAAAAELRAELPPRAFAAVPICPLLGFLDSAGTRVGCLAHPTHNGGVDLRDCGAYHAALCESFECPSFLWLTEAQVRLVRAACPDWYLYSRVITDVDFVRACLAAIERELAAAVEPDRIRAAPEALAALGAMLALKEHVQAGRSGRFVPGTDGEPTLLCLDYVAIGEKPAPEDDVLLCTELALERPGELVRARAFVRSQANRAALALAR